MNKGIHYIDAVFNRLNRRRLADLSRDQKYVTVEGTEFVKTQISQDIQKHYEDIVDGADAVMNLYSKDCKKGLYPFSRIIPLNNSWKLRCPIVKITPQNSKFLVSDYTVRYENEIPYLKRWFPKNAPVKGDLGDVVNVIVYSKEQLAKEGTKIDGDWGIVSINVEKRGGSPVTPQTMINNHLGIKFGGNGVKLNKMKYNESVGFWKTHAFKER